jgi:hypothetical protein
VTDLLLAAVRVRVDGDQLPDWLVGGAVALFCIVLFINMVRASRRTHWVPRAYHRLRTSP